jgi:uncharacterized protein
MSKYLLVLAIVAVAFWVWRNNRQNTKAESKKTPAPSSKSTAVQPQPMLQCAACGVHLPAADALVGRKGSYCSAAHQKQLEG